MSIFKTKTILYFHSILQVRFDTAQRETISLRDELDEERTRARNAKKDFDKLTRDYQRLSDNAAKSAKERDAQIEELKLRKQALERDIESMKRDFANQRDETKKVRNLNLKYSEILITARHSTHNKENDQIKINSLTQTGTTWTWPIQTGDHRDQNDYQHIGGEFEGDQTL